MKLSSIVRDVSEYGLHSSRAGDATVCINSGVSNRLINFIRDMGVGNRSPRRMITSKICGILDNRFYFD